MTILDILTLKKDRYLHFKSVTKFKVKFEPRAQKE